MILLFVFLALLSTGNGAILEIPLPDTIKECFRLAKARENPPHTVGEVVYSRCVQRILWTQSHSKGHVELTKETKRWVEGLVDMNSLQDVFYANDGHGIEAKMNGSDVPFAGIKPHRFRRQSRRRQPRVRKEYRTLSDQERLLFHRAINMLKADRTVSPNKFDALGQLHLMSVNRAHFGPNFLPWHRLFLLVVENALREKIPSVTIPYWDTTLDDKLLDSRSSILWTPEFLGTANGYVTDGPFAGWFTPMGQLIRYFGTSGTMLNWTFIQNVFRQEHLANISHPHATPETNLEEHHNQVHLWVGGHMAPPSLAAFDPVFYLLHSFVDMLWEIFRGLQRRKGIDPTTDYPVNDPMLADGHKYEDPSGFGSLLNRHALSDVFTNNIYKYNRPPSCTFRRPDCGSRYLRCDTSGEQSRCISASIFDVRRIFTPEGLPMDGSSGMRELRSIRNPGDKELARFTRLIHETSEVSCKRNNINEKYVNNYVIDGVPDRSGWGYIPIQIIYKNHVHKNAGMAIPVYEQCQRESKNNTAIRAFIETNGINYNGYFKEIAHFRNEAMTSSEIAYVGIRKPTLEVQTEVMVSAYDMCGRICQPYCLDLNSFWSKKCPGSLKINKDIPVLYENDVISASKSVWKDDTFGVPQLSLDKIAVTLVCDVNTSFWPW